MDDKINVYDIFRQAVNNDCSDIHIKPGAPPKMRKDGLLKAIPGYEGTILTAAQTEILTHETMDPAAFSRYDSEGEHIDYSFELEEVGRFRMNAYKTRGNDAFVARLLQDRPKTLDELGVDLGIKSLALSNNGLIIVTGATGSGKSTTMAGMIQHINTSKPVNIISIEDPIEILLQDAMASISQREIGSDVSSFDKALNAALREDPDVILIGEIREPATLKTALQAADTGHLVVATLHTTDTTSAINRILAIAPREEHDLVRQQLAATLKGIIGQRLVPGKRGGRIGVNEILLNNADVEELILESADERDFRKVLEDSPSMVTFEQSLIRHVEADRITLEVARANSNYPEYYDRINIQIPDDKTSVSKILPPFPGVQTVNDKPESKSLPTIPRPGTAPSSLPFPAPGVSKPTPVIKPKHSNPADLFK